MALAFNMGNDGIATGVRSDAWGSSRSRSLLRAHDFDVVDVGTTSWAPPRAAPGEKQLPSGSELQTLKYRTHGQ